MNQTLAKAIAEDFKAYSDGNGLTTPAPMDVQVGSGSDNGVMYTSEELLILFKNNALDDSVKARYLGYISACIDKFGILNRTPVPSTAGLESVDDYYGLLSACTVLGYTWIPRILLYSCIRHLGSMNNVRPGTWTFESFLIRQPQLLCAMITAAVPSKSNIVHNALRWLISPLYWYSAMVIAISCIGTSTVNCDSRRLCWHLIQVVRPYSFICDMAARLWYRRLYRDYGPNGMKAVAGIYYKPNGLGNNPFSKYWID